MQRPAERQELNEDGTPRRKYELNDVDESRLWFKMSLGLVLTSAVVLAKNILFGSKSQEYGDVAASGESEREQQLRDTEIMVETESESSAKTETDVADDLIRTFKSSLLPAFNRGDWATVANDSVSRLAHVPRGQTNDNVPLYGATPGYSVSLPQVESGSPYANLMGRAIDTGGSDALPRISNLDSPTPITPTPIITPPDRDRAANRLPVNSGTLNLGSLLVNSTFVLALAELLRNTSDADGDTLSVSNLRVSSGSVVVGTDGYIRFTPRADDTSSVTFTYAISDGTGAVLQTAYLDLLPFEPKTIEGTLGNDVLVGTPLDDVINALAGDDLIIAREGNDIVYAGEGNDRIIAGDGNDVIYAGGGNDFVLAGVGNDVVFGGAGHDIIFGEAGRDILYGGIGNDTIYGGDDDDVIDGEGDDDRLIGDLGNDVVNGGAGNDHIVATSQAAKVPVTTFTSSTSVDLIHATAPQLAMPTGDVTSGGAVPSAANGPVVPPPTVSAESFLVKGDDSNEAFTVYSAAAAAAAGITDIAEDAEIIVTRNGANNASVVAELRDVDLLQIDTGNSDDQVSFIGDFGSTAINVVDGGGSDTLDVTNFSSMHDVSFYSGGDDHVVGDIGHIDLTLISDGNDVYDGGEGNDTYDMSSACFDAKVDLTAATATSEDTGHDQIYNVENIISGRGDDNVVGDANANKIETNDGDDQIDAGSGDDIVRAGDGDDVIIAGATTPAEQTDGDDRYDGGDGSDTLDVSQAVADTIIDLVAGTAEGADIGSDVLQNIENVLCGDGNDTVYANEDSNTFSGGGGEDMFVFRSVESIGYGRGSRDRILDFDVGDRINLDDIIGEFEDAMDSSGSGSGSRPSFSLTFIGTNDSFSRPGELRLRYDEFDVERGTVLLEGNTNYNANAEFQLEFMGDLDDLAIVLAQSFVSQNVTSQI